MTEPKAIYDAIQAETDWSEMERKVFNALKRNPKGLNRPQLVAICFGENVRAGSTTNNNSKDRRVQLAIARLRTRMVPIISSSGEAGYRLDTSDEGRKTMLGELISRRNNLNDLITRVARMYDLPAEIPASEIVTQERLI